MNGEMISITNPSYAEYVEKHGGARGALARALEEWRDAGGATVDVVDAIAALAGLAPVAPSSEITDTMRLDWLEEKGYPGQFSKTYDDRGAWFDNTTAGSDYSNTLRDAIDAAIAVDKTKAAVLAEQPPPAPREWVQCSKSGFDGMCLLADGHEGECDLDDIPF